MLMQLLKFISPTGEFLLLIISFLKCLLMSLSLLIVNTSIDIHTIPGWSTDEKELCNKVIGYLCVWCLFVCLLVISIFVILLCTCTCPR